MIYPVSLPCWDASFSGLERLSPLVVNSVSQKPPCLAGFDQSFSQGYMSMIIDRI